MIPRPCLRALITGGRGNLGDALAKAIRSRWPDCAVSAPERSALDVTDARALAAAVKAADPQIVFNCAAFTQVDQAESQREAAWAVNASAVETLASLSRERGFRLVHYGTDQVFDGTGERPWTETDEPRPVNAYGASKLAGDRHALTAPDALVIRVQWLYGERNPRFLHLADRSEYRAIVDQLGAPTWVRDVASLSLDLVETGESGLFHLSHDDFASWFEVFERVRAHFGWPVRLVPTTTDALLLAARRPLFSVLDNRKLRHALGRDTLGSWKDRLNEFLETLHDVPRPQV